MINMLRGGGQAYNFGKFDFEIWVEEKGHVPTFFRVVLGPCAKCCSCEASEQKWGQKSKSRKIRLSQSDEKLPSYFN